MCHPSNYVGFPGFITLDLNNVSLWCVRVINITVLVFGVHLYLLVPVHTKSFPWYLKVKRGVLMLMLPIDPPFHVLFTNEEGACFSMQHKTYLHGACVGM